MTLVKDLDLVPCFTNRHTTILGPKVFDHASFADLEIPLRTRIFLDRRNRLLFLLQIPGRDHPAWLFVVLVVVYAGRNILVISWSRVGAQFPKDQRSRHGALLDGPR